MAHSSVKTIIITKVVELISAKHKLSINEARDMLYSSRLIKLINDDETGLYGESPLYLFSLYENELNKRKKYKKYGL